MLLQKLSADVQYRPRPVDLQIFYLCSINRFKNEERNTFSIKENKQEFPASLEKMIIHEVLQHCQLGPQLQHSGSHHHIHANLNVLKIKEKDR